MRVRNNLGSKKSTQLLAANFLVCFLIFNMLRYILLIGSSNGLICLSESRTCYMSNMASYSLSLSCFEKKDGFLFILVLSKWLAIKLWKRYRNDLKYLFILGILCCSENIPPFPLVRGNIFPKKKINIFYKIIPHTPTKIIRGKFLSVSKFLEPSYRAKYIWQTDTEYVY